MTNKKAKLTAPVVPMPCQDPKIRAKNFNEVALGYSLDQARTEAARCLQCKKPKCVAGCPVGIDIPAFIHQVAENDIAGAYLTLRKSNSLPAVCGRVCPQEHQCEGQCILGKKFDAVAIGRLERFVADHALAGLCEGFTKDDTCAMPREDLKVACIGSGPSSIAAAGYLAAHGISVEIFEALHEAGGVLIYGIPAFRLPKDVVHKELDGLREMGVKIHTNWVGGRTFTVQGLLDQDFQAVFIGIGAGLPWFLGIPGENFSGVFSANEYLTRVNLGRAYAFPDYDTPITEGKHVAVFGAGNVAMDAARTALRLGADKVSIVYRRTRAEMPAREEEIEHALEEGVELLELMSPTQFEADDTGWLQSVTLEHMRLGEPDSSGRCRPEPTGNTSVVPIDLAIIAVGTKSNPVLLEATPGLVLNKRGYIEVDEQTGETSIPNVYAGGDIVTGAATVILAMGAGRQAAEAICRRLL